MKKLKITFMSLLMATYSGTFSVFSQIQSATAAESQAQIGLQLTAQPTSENLQFGLGFYHWNSFRVVIHNQSNEVISIKPGQFVLVNTETGKQYNALSLNDAFLTTVSALGTWVPHRLEPHQKTAIAPLALKEALVLPGARIEGVVFFNKKLFVYKPAESKAKLFFVSEAGQVMNVDLLPALGDTW
ncbi:MAG: hypothetical protein AB7I41_07155 [Candidatus Sericytochromatia bacterium]